LVKAVRRLVDEATAGFALRGVRMEGGVNEGVTLALRTPKELDFGGRN
jgi:hypothetical protein